MHRACEDCDRLWQAYQEAIKDHVQLLEEYQAAVIGQNSIKLAQLDPLLGRAGKLRLQARQAVIGHEATHGSNQEPLPGS